MGQGRAPRIGLLWRGDRRVEPPSARVDTRLGSLVEAFSQRSASVEHVVFAGDALTDVRTQLLGLDGVMVWVNPIQDGENREGLDALLREVASRGVWVSAHPDTILKMGTKEVLHSARDLVWGSDVELYRSIEEFADRFSSRLATHRRLVVKQGRGNGGDGVWKVEQLHRPGEPDAAAVMLSVQDARVSDGSSERVSFADFLTRCEQYFEWSGCLIDQPFQVRVADGMLRCYFCFDEVIGFCRQWPSKGLLDTAQAAAARVAPRESVMESADAPAYQALRRQAETEWLPQLLAVLNLDPESLPAVWDADFLLGSTTTAGEDTYVLCEINMSAVWPFPPTAAHRIATAALSRVAG